MRIRSLTVISFAVWTILGVSRAVVADTHDADPSHHGPIHHDPMHHDPRHHDPHHQDPHHHDPLHQDPHHHDPMHHDPTHHDPVHHDPIHHDPMHHDPHHVDHPHHHAGDDHSLTASPHFVDQSDLLLWSTGFGLSGSATHMDGNADADLDVDGADFLVWQRQLGSAVATPATATVPEPASFALLAVSGLGIAAIRRRLSPELRRPRAC
jgi:hypothetical protein